MSAHSHGASRATRTGGRASAVNGLPTSRRVQQKELDEGDLPATFPAGSLLLGGGETFRESKESDVMLNRTHRATALALFALLLLVTGCTDQGPERGTVTGVVTYFGGANGGAPQAAVYGVATTTGFVHAASAE